jgi:Tol biopolymer transport system component
VKTCLRKDPEQRCQTAHDALLQLQFIFESGAHAASAAPEFTARKRWVLGASLILLAAALGFGLGTLFFRRPAEPAQPVRFSVSPPESATFTDADLFFAVSPDGRHLAFSALDSSGKQSLWVRSLDSLSAWRLPGTDDAFFLPSWSPDSRFIAFTARGKLMKVDISGGFPQIICDIPESNSAAVTWGRNNVIIFERFERRGPLYSVSAAGGSPKPVTTLDSARKEQFHIYPYFLPDGRHFLYLAMSAQPQFSGVYIGSLDSDSTRLLDVVSYTAYASPGYLLFSLGDSLMAQPFDAMTLKLAGEPVRIAEHVLPNAFGDGIRLPAISLSQTGVLAYRNAASALAAQLTWIDRTGKEVESFGDRLGYIDFELSPDEKSVAAVRRDTQTGDTDIWIVDRSRGTDSRFTFDPKTDFGPLWSPDNNEIIFGSTRDDPGNTYDNLYRKGSSGAQDEQPLFKTDNVRIHRHPTDWSSDGRYVLFDAADSFNKYDVWVLPLFGDRSPFPFLKTEFDEQGGRFSPDGQWVAYFSNESGRYEVYVRPFPKSDEKWQISTNGGVQPRWTRNGKELFYRDLSGKLMAVTVKTKPKFEASVPKALFEISSSSYAVTADGQRFLVTVPTQISKVSPITVVLNWATTLKK